MLLFGAVNSRRSMQLVVILENCAESAQCNSYIFVSPEGYYVHVDCLLIISSFHLTVKN